MSASVSIICGVCAPCLALDYCGWQFVKLYFVKPEGFHNVFQYYKFNLLNTKNLEPSFLLSSDYIELSDLIDNDVSVFNHSTGVARETSDRSKTHQIPLMFAFLQPFYTR